jgi:hypothetical protein
MGRDWPVAVATTFETGRARLLLRRPLDGSGDKRFDPIGYAGG